MVPLLCRREEKERQVTQPRITRLGCYSSPLRWALWNGPPRGGCHQPLLSLSPTIYVHITATPGEAARLLWSQKSRRFCQIAKSPTSFDPASITPCCCRPRMSAPASVPRVARPSEATAFARSVPHPSRRSSSLCCGQWLLSRTPRQSACSLDSGSV